MILNSLYIENFRIYKGPIEIFFAKGDKNITIIQGDNEIGKTTIMNAIWWCLYNNEPFKDEGKESILNMDTFNKMNVGDEQKVIVKLNMEDNKGKEVIFQRELSFGKVSNSKTISDSSSDFIITVDGDLVSNTNTYKATHLPEKIREYFLFDGEQLEKYFGDENSKNIKNAVFKLSQLNLLDKIKNHIKEVEKDYIRDFEDVKPQESKLLKTKLEYESKLEKLSDELKNIDKNISNWQESIETLEENLKSYGPDPEKLVNDRKNLQDELKSRDRELSEEKAKYKLFLVDSFNKIFAMNLFKNVNKLTDDLEEKGFIPSRYKREFLDYLLENHECICGTDLSEGSDGYNKILELCKKTDEITNIADVVNELRGRIKSLMQEFPDDFLTDLNNLVLSIDNKESLRNNIDSKIMDINNLLDSDKDKDIIKLNNEIKYYKKLINNNIEKRGSIKEKISSYGDELSGIDSEIKKEKSKHSISSNISKSIDFCSAISNEVNDIYNTVNNDIHRKLERLTSEEFKNIHWKSSYDDIRIDDDYVVTIMSKGSVKSPADLSAGGKLSLALSFTTALNSLSGFELPILIDTPLGRLGESIKENIGKNLHNYVVGKQVTFIVTDSEYSEGFHEGIKDFIGKEYVLEHNVDKGEFTEVRDVNEL